HEPDLRGAGAHGRGVRAGPGRPRPVRRARGRGLRRAAPRHAAVRVDRGADRADAGGCRAGQAPDHLTGPAVARTWDGPPVVALLDGYVVVVPFAPPARPVTATVGTRGRPRAGSVGSRASCTGKEERKSAARRRYQEGD